MEDKIIGEEVRELGGQDNRWNTLYRYLKLLRIKIRVVLEMVALSLELKFLRGNISMLAYHCSR